MKISAFNPLIVTPDADGAKELFETRGFVNAQGDKITETPSSRATLMVSPSGFAISLGQHIKS